MDFMLFIVSVVILVLLLTGGYIVRHFKKVRKAVQDAAERKEQRFRDEVGRQRQQYSQRPQKPQDAKSAGDSTQASDTGSQHSGKAQEEKQKKEARRTQMATGETIIDHHHEKREGRKIFDENEGEYVDFEEA